MNKKQIQEKFWHFRELCKTHVYSEPDSNIHQNVMNTMIPKVINEYNLNENSRILDVGCGQGYGLLKFYELGCTNLKGITLSKEDVDAAKNRGFDVDQQDMSFMDFDKNSFDFLFVRHALEHSPYPLLTLLEFYRVMDKQAKAYIEMPNPTCTRDLESYDNHYSIMGTKQWSALMKRAGFKLLDIGEIKFDIHHSETKESLGIEVYEWYILEKP